MLYTRQSRNAFADAWFPTHENTQMGLSPTKWWVHRGLLAQLHVPSLKRFALITRHLQLLSATYLTELTVPFNIFIRGQRLLEMHKAYTT